MVKIVDYDGNSFVWVIKKTRGWCWLTVRFEFGMISKSF